MALAIFDHHNAPIFAFIDRFQQIIYGGVFLLNIHIRHTYFVKVLDFVVDFSHVNNYRLTGVIIKRNMRQQSKSSSASFHEVEGGAIPTLTHQIINERTT